MDWIKSMDGNLESNKEKYGSNKSMGEISELNKENYGWNKKYGCKFWAK